MAKFYLFILISLFLKTALIAQTDAEREAIKQSYNIESINKLKNSIIEKNKQRELRVEKYLKGKKSKDNILKNGKVLRIYDVIDGKPIYRTTHNLNSARATGTNDLWTGGDLGLDLNGENMIIGVWDEEDVRATHQEFLDDQVVPESRVTFPELAGTTRPASDHATHVAGTLIAKGTVASRKGMAPKANLRSFDWDNDNFEAITEATDGLLISNHSYGVSIFDNNSPPNLQVSAANIGAYDSDARTWDELAFNAPYYLAVNSAGNNGSNSYTGALGSGYDKLYGNKTAKNNLVVASALTAVNASGNLAFFQHSTFSSQGPTDDFRVKPDITGDGEGVWSTGVDADDDYFQTQGTSMASPNVAGSLILLQQYYNQLNSSYMKAATVKALVCHTATDDNVKVGPDPRLGWGILNNSLAASTITDDSNSLALIQEETLNNSATFTYEFSAGAGDLSATICWTDPAGTVSSSPGNSLTPRLVNDLDLRIQDPGGTTHLPWKLDSSDVTADAIKGDNDVDNIENIDIASGASGTYTLTVTHKGSLTNGTQDFSIILTGINLTLNTQKVDDTRSVNIWPNPVEDILYLDLKSFTGNVTITLLDINGRKIVQKRNIKTKTFNIETRAFNPGIYFINITGENYNAYKKLIVK